MHTLAQWPAQIDNIRAKKVLQRTVLPGMCRRDRDASGGQHVGSGRPLAKLTTHLFAQAGKRCLVFHVWRQFHATRLTVVRVSIEPLDQTLRTRAGRHMLTHHILCLT